MAKPQLPKLAMRVRFPLSAPKNDRAGDERNLPWLFFCVKGTGIEQEGAKRKKTVRWTVFADAGV